MKRLTLLRHAQAAEAAAGQDDHERPLTDKGREAAAAVGRATASALPDLVLCSDAARTRETMALVAAQWPRRPEIVDEPRLYMATCETLIALVLAAPERAAALWLVGHNPGIAELARWLARASDSPAYRTLAERFPTATRAVLASEAERWDALEPGSLALVDLVRA